MTDKLQQIATFSFPHEAQLAKACLESAGIPTHLTDLHTINMDWLWSNALGGVKVFVAEEHVDDAVELLNSDFSAAVAENFPEDVHEDEQQNDDPDNILKA